MKTNTLGKKVKLLITKINEKLNKTSSDLKCYENLSCEQKENIDSGKINSIETFKGGKYSDEIGNSTVKCYVEMLMLELW